MGKSLQFFLCCVGFLLGVFISSWIIPEKELLLEGLIVGAFSSVLLWKYPLPRVAILACGCVILGMLRFGYSIPLIDKGHIGYYVDAKRVITGTIRSEPDVRDDQVKYTLEDLSIDGGITSVVRGRLLITTSLYPRYQYGDFLTVNCFMKKPEPIETFRYDLYLERYGIYALCYSPEIISVEKGSGNRFFSSIYSFKEILVGRINAVLPEPHSSFLSGILIGAKRSMPEELQQLFKRTGTTHIVAVSGYNVTILALFFMEALKMVGISRKKAFWVICVGLLLFSVLTGLQSSIIRASLMGFLVLLSQQLGRKSMIRNTLAVAAVIMVLVNPRVLMTDLGFQLSFLATIGLVYLSPVFMAIGKIHEMREGLVKNIVGNYLITTLSAICMTTPLTLYQFGTFSFIAPFANIAVLPLIPIAMALGFITVIFSLIWIPLGAVVGWGAWAILQGIISILRVLGGLSVSYGEVGTISPLGLLISYSVLVVMMGWGSVKLQKKNVV